MIDRLRDDLGRLQAGVYITLSPSGSNGAATVHGGTGGDSAKPGDWPTPFRRYGLKNRFSIFIRR